MKTIRQIGYLFLTVSLFTACSSPKAEFEFPIPSEGPVEIQFNNTSTGANDFVWDFGDGTSSTEKSPKHFFTKFGDIEVKLTASSGEKANSIVKKFTLTESPRRQVKISTEYGDMVAELYNSTPKHRDNFIKLASEGFFNDLLFHRVIQNFMIQGGDPNSKGAAPEQMLGTGGPGYTVPAEMVNGLYHFKGALSAARQPDQVNPLKASSGSQFYIVQGQQLNDGQLNQMEARQQRKYPQEIREAYKKNGGTPFLDYDYTVFGRVIEGLEVIDKIALVEKGANDRPASDVKMTITVIK